MGMFSLAATGSVLSLALAVLPPAARATELKVIAGGSMTAVLNELGPQFERTSGHKVTVQFGSTPQLIKQVASDTPFDVGVVPVEVFKDAAARERFAPGPTVDIARVGYGVAVRAGAPKPDVSSPEALKQTLRNTPSIAMLPESAAGAYVLSVFAKLGIADAMKAKIKLQSTPAQIPQAVAKGDAELGVFLTNVLAAPGVELAGPFPGDLQQELVFSAAVATKSAEADAAKAFISFLRTPASLTAIKAKGMTPG
ncbi:molybdate ABC transporter substrate-binding protein [Rhodoplanes sp. Z2-YC6860]|uniref:molybdate ABC transporter substrate-binding protein n=1 Tax=Rhodoplanes sp. Z2-YC6860 TaxID=674703 RepID=UPI00078E3E8D|nr:molybdate ABC transporter substrate-binding protein [Rhodoplanes sp. Z2-YC6860]AMN42146.1 molybdate ABC transporter, periplasmic molybdate-binding protein [Rhodoplanes sp. Z2-YC6860]